MAKKSCSIAECEHIVKQVMMQASNSNESDTKELLSARGMNIRISCRPCDATGVEGVSRGFMMNHPLEMVLCTNRMNKTDVKEVLRHEAIHAHDYHHGTVDFSTCKGVAYSEVRAAREAECDMQSRYLVGPLSVFADMCVKQHAVDATNNVFPGQGRKCVDAVFDEAIKSKTIIITK